MLFRLRRFAGSFLLSFLLAACSNNQTAVPSSTGTSHPPAATSTAATTAPAISANSLTSTPANQPAPLLTIGKGEIASCEYSPDGKSLGVISSIGVYIYDPASLKQLDTISTGSSVAAFSPDWSHLAIGQGSTIRLLRLKDKKIEAQLDTDEGRVSRLLFSPDGSLLASFVWPAGGEQYNNFIDLWRVPDGTRLTSWDAGLFPWGAAFSRDGSRLITWDGFAAEARAWQIPSGKPQVGLPSGKHLNAAAYSPDGRLVASQALSEPSTMSPTAIKIERAADGTPVSEFQVADQLTIKFLQFSRDSSLLAGYGLDGTVQVWRMKDGAILPGYKAMAADFDPFLAISPDNHTLALPSPDGLDLYDLAGGQIKAHLGNSLSRLRQAALSPQGDAVAVLLETGVGVWKLPEGQMSYILPDTNAYRLAWSPDGTQLALGGADGKVRLWLASDGSLLKTFAGHLEAVQSAAFSPDGTLLASSSMDSIKVWRAKDGGLLEDLGVAGGWVSSLRFSADGKQLAASSANNGIEVWRVDDWKQIAQSPASSFGDSDVFDFNPDGSTMAVGETTGISLWTLPPNNGIRKLDPADEQVVTVRISPDGSLLAGGLADGRIGFWQLPEGRLQYSFQAAYGSILSLDFSADGKTLMSASSDGLIKMWGLEKFPISK